MEGDIIVDETMTMRDKYHRRMSCFHRKLTAGMPAQELASRLARKMLERERGIENGRRQGCRRSKGATGEALSKTQMVYIVIIVYGKDI